MESLLAMGVPDLCWEYMEVHFFTEPYIFFMGGHMRLFWLFSYSWHQPGLGAPQMPRRHLVVGLGFGPQDLEP